MARILVVDDEEVVRAILIGQLGLDGHVCDTAANGREAVEKVQQSEKGTEYDLILTDVRMPPPVDGLQFLRAVKSRVEHTTPCVVVTTSDKLSDARDAMKAGAFDYIQKPWELEDLRIAVNRALQRRADLRFRREYQADLERRVDETVAELKRTYDATIIGFAVLLEGKDSRGDGKDTSTADHCIRVRDMCSRLGREMRLGADRIRDLELGAMVHDIGKYKIHDDILDKPGKLTDKEWEIMRRHPEFGAEAVARIEFLRGATDVVLAHHERWDGGGYPRGLRGEEIPLAARIFMVVDAYDTITSKRSYKEAQDPQWALEEIRRCAGTHFDPAVVAAFERVYAEFAAETRQRSVGAAATPHGLGADARGAAPLPSPSRRIAAS